MKFEFETASGTMQAKEIANIKKEMLIAFLKTLEDDELSFSDEEYCAVNFGTSGIAGQGYHEDKWYLINLRDRWAVSKISAMNGDVSEDIIKYILKEGEIITNNEWEPRHSCGCI